MYTLKLLPTDSESIQKSRIQVITDAQDFVTRRFSERIYAKKSLELEEMSLLEDMLTARFWGTLGKVDGFIYNFDFISNLGEQEKVKEQAIKTREWAQQNFRPYELDKILNIAVNQALIRPFENARPGTYRAHSILYRELVEKEGSLFAEAVTPDFKKKLNNGRFWEGLPDVRPGLNGGIGIHVVYDVLMNHFDDLEVEFAPEGLALMSPEIKNQKSLENISLHTLGEEAMGKYVSFVEKIAESNVINTEKVEILLQPYLFAVLGWDGEMRTPYYDGQEDYDNNMEKRGRFQDKLQVPVMQKYLASSEKLRTDVANRLARGVSHTSNEYGEYARFMQEVLGAIPDGKKLMKPILEKIHTEAGLRFFAKGKEHGYDLFTLLE